MAWDGVKSRKFRFALNLVGILIGCAAVTGLISITQGLSLNISDQLQILGPQNIMIVPGQMSTMRGMAIGTITYKDLNTISNVEHVTITAPIIGNRFATYNVKSKVYRGEVFGITEDFIRINQNAEIAEGRALVRSDSGVIIIGANIAQPKDQDSPILGVGDRITLEAKVGDQIKSITVRVIGVLKKTGASFGVNLDDSMAIPMRDAQTFFETGNQYTYIMAQADTLENVDSTAKAIKNKLGRGYTTVTYESGKAIMDQVIGSVQAVLGGIAAISLIVAGVGIINTMTISVMERTKEIGTLKALGAKSRDILMIFLTESVLTGIIGGLFGASLGFILSQIISQFVAVQAVTSLMLGFEVIGFAVLTSVLSGIYPAYRASHLSPVEALRHE
jgi:putative ABC transport system permease protein